MSTREARREPRIKINLPVTVKMPAGDHSYQTDDASYRGVFLTCPEPLPLRKLVRFTTVLREDEEPLEMLGLVAHTVNQADAKESGRSPGMGIQLYSVGKETRERWREFIREEYEKRPEVRDEVRKLDLPRVTVHMRTLDQLVNFVENDLMAGGIFVRTSDLQKQGADVVCEIVHPEHGEPFPLEATVASVTEAPRRDRGMELVFGDVDEDTLHGLVAFIESEEEVEELDADMLEVLD
ncbi:MAG: PilZ domain-containing protein [Myxococcota bacterium]